ncbi:hypothetical protein C2G38_2199725 [Gigaspora rosea]|uniref:Uncharacterized protein n=1 Tax=Gigaspora rosea TaxID=44941 RepID=A0A397V083_9GLOM|nr:hypothetical protein C2G38_2199725 [Gigaspora rosea]
MSYANPKPIRPQFNNNVRSANGYDTFTNLIRKESTSLDLYNLGYNYQHGIGVEKDEHKATNRPSNMLVQELPQSPLLALSASPLEPIRKKLITF